MIYCQLRVVVFLYILYRSGKRWEIRQYLLQKLSYYSTLLAGEGYHSCCCGAGGSGYVGDVTNGATIAGDSTMPRPSGGTEQGHHGEGYAIISWISPSL